MLPFIYKLNKIPAVSPPIMNRALVDEVSIVAWNIGENTTHWRHRLIRRTPSPRCSYFLRP